MLLFSGMFFPPLFYWTTTPLLLVQIILSQRGISWYLHAHTLLLLFIYCMSVCLCWIPRWLSGWRVCLQCRRHRRRGFSPWVGKIRWRREWQPTPVYLPGESFGQRSLVSSSPWGYKEWDMTEWLTPLHVCLPVLPTCELFEVGRHICMFHHCTPTSRTGQELCGHSPVNEWHVGIGIWVTLIIF